MGTEDATNPVGGEDTAEANLETETEVETEQQIEEEVEPQYDGNGNLIEPEEAEDDEDEEVELDGDLKLKVPKDQAQKIREHLLRQSDYTKKTQSLADERKAFDNERAQLHQSTQQELNAYATATNLAQQLAAYQNVDWNAWEDQDPFEAQKGWRTFQQMKDAHQGALNQLSHLSQQRQAAAQQETAKRIGEGRQQLTSEIGWNDELKAKLTDYALGMGLSRDDLADLEATPAAAKILLAAYEGVAAKTAASKLANLANKKNVEPAKVLKGTSGATAVKATTKDFAAFEKLAEKAAN